MFKSSILPIKHPVKPKISVAALHTHRHPDFLQVAPKLSSEQFWIQRSGAVAQCCLSESQVLSWYRERTCRLHEPTTLCTVSCRVIVFRSSPCAIHLRPCLSLSTSLNDLQTVPTRCPPSKTTIENKAELEASLWAEYRSMTTSSQHSVTILHKPSGVQQLLCGCIASRSILLCKVPASLAQV